MHLSAYKGIERWTILLILFVVKDSHETSNEDLAEAIQQLTILVDTKLIQLDSNMNIMNTKFESEINKMNTRFESQERHYTEDKTVKEKISEDLETVKSKVIILEGHFYYVKLLQEQYYIENRAVNKQNTEDLQGLKDKVISLEGNLNVIKDIHTNSYEEINERGLSFDTNVNEIKVMSNETTELLSIINVSLNEEVLDLKQDLALLTDTINEIKTLTNNTSEEIKLLQEERTSCNSAFNNLTSISNEIFKKLATIDTKIIEMDNVSEDPTERINRCANDNTTLAPTTCPILTCPPGIQEVSFSTNIGTAKASSIWSNDFREEYGFAKPAAAVAWCSQNGGGYPKSIWYEFQQVLRVVKYSFQSRLDGWSHEVFLGPSRYEFWGSDDIDCSKTETRVTLIEDNSGTPFTSENIPKVGNVENPHSYRCYGFTINATPENYQYTCMSNIRLYYISDDEE